MRTTCQESKTEMSGFWRRDKRREKTKSDQKHRISIIARPAYVEKSTSSCRSQVSALLIGLNEKDLDLVHKGGDR
jgi:carbohydrate-selective porin OprB